MALDIEKAKTAPITKPFIQDELLFTGIASTAIIFDLFLLDVFLLITLLIIPPLLLNF